MNINPIGIDQTTGQQRPVAPTDSVVNNFGSQLTLGVIQAGDYSQQVNPVNVLAPWGSPQLVSNPASLPPSISRICGFSSNGEYLAVTQTSNSPFIYQRVGSNFYKLADPASIVNAETFDLSWNTDGQFLAFTNNGSPSIHIYQRSGSTFTKLANPASLPQGLGISLDWSPTGEFLCVGSQGAPYLTIYQRSGTTFTRLADVASLPQQYPDESSSLRWAPNGQFFVMCTNNFSFPGQGVYIYQRTGLTQFTLLPDPASIADRIDVDVSWSPDSQFLAFTRGAGLRIYQRSGTTFTPLASPASLPNSTAVSNWSPDGQYLAVTTGAGGDPAVLVYQRNNITFTLLSGPSSLPGGAWGPEWTNNQQYLAVALNVSPYLAIYQTGLTTPSSGIVINRQA